MRSFLLILLFSSQDGGLTSTLRQGGWRAVDDLGARPETRPDLARLAEGGDPELCWWANAALAELDAREQGGDAYAAPLRVTLDAKERPAGEVLRELFSSAKGRSLDVPEGDRPVTLTLMKAPFLEAVDEVCRQSGLVLARAPGGRAQAVSGELPRGPCFYHAGFAVTILSIVRRTEVTFRENPSTQLQLSLLLRAEPRVRVLDEEVPCPFVRAEDDTGRSLLLDETKRTVRVRGAAELGSVAQFSLAVPASEATKIKTLRGVATLTLAKKVEEIVFENVGKNGTQGREAGGIRASLKKAAREGEDVRVEVELSSNGRVHWPETENLVLEDAEGRAFQRWGSSMSSSGGEATYRLTFRNRDGAGNPEKLRVPVVTETYARKVYFELKDVPLK